MSTLQSLNGAERVIEMAVTLEVNVCFANPGTTEMAFVAALDKVDGIRPVLCLFEGVCTGAADGYGRMTGKPAMTLLHLGPGFANGIANLHNARRAHSPVVNLVGDHASWHVQYDAPLTSDITSLARPVSGWVKTVTKAEDITADFQAAVAVSKGPPGCGATLILPTDYQEAIVPPAVREATVPSKASFSETKVDAAARVLLGDEPCILLIGGEVLSEQGQKMVAGIARTTGAQVMVETFPARIERGRGLPAFDRLPYFPEDVLRAVEGAHVILVGTGRPVSYFGYEGLPSLLVKEDKLVPVTGVVEDSIGALEQLFALVGADPWQEGEHEAAAEAETGPLSAGNISTLLTKHLPDNAIVVPEGSTCSVPFYKAAANGPRHTILTNTGGAIGQGPALAVGCAVACPHRKVINLQSDGSALYTIQSLWTQAREKLDVLTLIVSNQRYAILQVELKRSGQTEPGAAAQALTQLNNPPLDWVSIANGFGVPAARVETAEELGEQLKAVMARPGPYVIEMLV